MSNAVIHHETQTSQIITTQAENVRLYGAAFDRAASEGREAVRTAMFSRLLAGAALVAIKNQCEHGEYEEVCLREFPTTPLRTMQNWKARADQDLRNKELRAATEAVLVAGEDEAARKTFEEVADRYFAAKPTLMLHAAQEMHLLGNGRERKPAEARPAKKLTDEDRWNREARDLREAVQSLIAGAHTLATADSIGTWGKLAALAPHDFLELKAHVKSTLGGLLGKLDKLKVGKPTKRK